MTIRFITVSFLVEVLPFALAAGFFLGLSPLGANGPGSPYHISMCVRRGKEYINSLTLNQTILLL